MRRRVEASVDKFALRFGQIDGAAGGGAPVSA